MSRRVLMTGARGFLGRHLTTLLTSQGWSVEPVMRGERPGSYRRGGSLGDVATIVHLAFPTDHAYRAAHPLRVLTEVAAGTTFLADLASRSGASHLVIASSGKVYGRPAALPTSEREPVAPTTDLGKLKALVEHVARLGGQAGRFGVTSLRLFNVYGEGQSGAFVVPKLVRAARCDAEITLGELDHRRDWIHVHDAVRAFESVIEAPPAPGVFRPINVGTGRVATVRQLLGLIEAAIGTRPRWRQDPGLLRPDEPPEERADVTGAASLGWTPAIGLDKGIERTVMATAPSW